MKSSFQLTFLLGFIGALLVYHFATLGRVPAFLTDDDGGYASAAWQFWNTGRPGAPGYRDALGLNRDVWAFGRTAAAVQGVFLHFFGVSIFAALLPSFLTGVGLLAAVAVLGQKLWDAPTGLLAASLLAASGKFFEATHMARPDLLLALFFVAGLCLAASAREEKPYGRLLLAGLVMGLAGDVHLNGFLIAPVPLLLWLLARPERNRGRWRAAVVYSGAVLIGLLFWLALHYWPDTALFRRQLPVFGGQTHGLKIAKLGLLGALSAEARRYTDWFWRARGHRHILEGMCVLAGGVWVLWTQGSTGRAITAAWFAMFLIATVFMSNPFGWYLILVWPLFALWMARALLSFPHRGLARLILLALIGAYVANLAAWHWKARQDVPLQARLSELRQLLPAGAPVLGNGALWFAFWDRDYTDAMYLQFRELEVASYPGSEPTGWVGEQQKHGWRYIVAYGDLRRFLDPEVPLDAVLASDVYRGRISTAREARNFVLTRCSIERRIPGFGDSILVVHVNGGKPDGAR